MSEVKLYGAGTYKCKPRGKIGPVYKAHPNYLKQCFIAQKPNDSWVSDITYIRTHEGWLYLATVIDLYSRKVNRKPSNNITHHTGFKNGYHETSNRG